MKDAAQPFDLKTALTPHLNKFFKVLQDFYPDEVQTQQQLIELMRTSALAGKWADHSDIRAITGCIDYIVSAADHNIFHKIFNPSDNAPYRLLKRTDITIDQVKKCADVIIKEYLEAFRSKQLSQDEIAKRTEARTLFEAGLVRGNPPRMFIDEGLGVNPEYIKYQANKIPAYVKKIEHFEQAVALAPYLATNSNNSTDTIYYDEYFMAYYERAMDLYDCKAFEPALKDVDKALLYFDKKLLAVQKGTDKEEIAELTEKVREMSTFRDGIEKPGFAAAILAERGTAASPTSFVKGVEVRREQGKQHDQIEVV